MLSTINEDLANAISVARKALVTIRDGRRGNGAGTVWHSKGLILTNAHVVNGRSPVIELQSGDRLQAKVLARDRNLDLAALSVSADELETIPLGDSRRLRPGEFVIAIGHPWGVSAAATAGSLIDIGSDLPELSMRGDLMALALHLRPGHSGGPVLNASGELVGINTMMAGPDVGVAVPIHVVKRFLKINLD
jgi:S1-C subfamily serine protease